MPNVKNALQLFEEILSVEGRRLGYLAAAQFIENELVATDLDAPARTLRSERLFGVVVPRDILHETAWELRAKAAELDGDVKALMATKCDADITGRTGKKAAPRRTRKCPQLILHEDTDAVAMAG